jgi:hypothetical protein
MNITVYGKDSNLILTFRDKTISSKVVDVAGRTIQQRILCPLTVLPSKKVLSDISIRMNMFTVDGNFQGIEQNIRLEVETRSLQEQELLRYQRKWKDIQETIHEISILTQSL